MLRTLCPQPPPGRLPASKTIDSSSRVVRTDSRVKHDHGQLRVVRPADDHTEPFATLLRRRVRRRVVHQDPASRAEQIIRGPLQAQLSFQSELLELVEGRFAVVVAVCHTSTLDAAAVDRTALPFFRVVGSLSRFSGPGAACRYGGVDAGDVSATQTGRPRSTTTRKLAARAAQQRKLAARAARRFPQRPFDAARVTGSGALDLIVALYGLPARGRCATTAATAVKTGSSGERVLALAHPVCPPPAALTAADNASPTEALLVSGTPGWAARPYKDESHNWVGLAADPRCSAGLLHVWGETSPTTPTRADDVAANPAVPPRLLSRLAADSDRVVRSAAATNPNCPRWLLAPLSGDTSSDVRVAAAANPNCPPHLLAGLANDPDRMVRAAVAARCDCPPRLLAGLVRDPRPEVRSAAAATAASACSSSLLEDFCVDACSEARAVVAARIDCPPLLLRHLLLDPVMGVRVAAAANPSCPPPQRRPLRLPRFLMFEMRAAVAANPNCPRVAAPPVRSRPCRGGPFRCGCRRCLRAAQPATSGP